MLKILLNEEQIASSRKELVSLGASAITPNIWRKLYRFVPLNVYIGDYLKSWDVHKTIELILKTQKKDSKIIDIGAFRSEVPVSLSKLGFTNVHALDLNKAVLRMPGRNRVKYIVGDFYQSGFEDSSFDVVTSISVIEHGLDCPKLLQEIARLLRSDGYFVASFDYWWEKVNTDDVSDFGMSWTIFSKSDVISLISEAAKFGLYPIGELNFDCTDAPISWHDRNYTFGWLVLQKRSEEVA